jgi:ornithine cyclodeaminase/alanine dehydrogenase
LTFPDYVRAVESAFRQHAEGKSFVPILAHIDAEDGELHIKGSGLTGDDPCFAVKVNAGFFENGPRYQLPSIQGLILLTSARNGVPLALMDSGEITVRRTAAATGIAARLFARPGSRVCTLCGTGTQARAQLEAILHFFPLEQVFVWPRHWEHALAFASQMQPKVKSLLTPTQDLSGVLAKSEICISCTSSRQPFIDADAVPAGMFLAAVGADSPGKQELDPRLLAKAKIITDLTAQAIEVGETHHAIAQGLISDQYIHAELGEVIAGLRCGRQSESEIIVFDSTGTALQDVASAVAAYQQAVAKRVGKMWDAA